MRVELTWLFSRNGQPRWRFYVTNIQGFVTTVAKKSTKRNNCNGMSSTKLVRQNIWSKLKDVALPDSRFHLNFAEVIPDFLGSAAATERIFSMPIFKHCKYAFVTPDNCLVELRRRMLDAGITLVVSTYGIYRGFYILRPEEIDRRDNLFAAWLDGLEHFGKPISLAEIGALGRFDLMVTGASAVSLDGVRFGKGSVEGNGTSAARVRAL